MTIKKLLELLPTTFRKGYSEKVCECGKTRGENVEYILMIECSYSAPIDNTRPKIEGNRYKAYYKPNFIYWYKENPKIIENRMGSYRTLEEALEELYIFMEAYHPEEIKK